MKDLKKHYDPARRKREAEEKEAAAKAEDNGTLACLLASSVTEEAKALEIAAAMSDATAAAFIGAIAGLALNLTIVLFI